MITATFAAKRYKNLLEIKEKVGDYK